MSIMCTQGTYDLSITVHSLQIRRAASSKLHPHRPLIGRVCFDETPYHQGSFTAESECLLDVWLCNSRTHFRASMCQLKCVRLITRLIWIFRWRFGTLSVPAFALRLIRSLYILITLEHCWQGLYVQPPALSSDVDT